MRKIFVIVVSACLFSCHGHDAKPGITHSVSDNKVTDTIQKNSPDAAPDSATLMSLSNEVLTAIKNRDYNNLASFIHPQAGIRFAPYSYIDTAKDQLLSAAQLIELATKKNKINWNSVWTEDEPALIDIDTYFKDFVYDVDFLNAPVKSVNRFHTQSAALNNINEVYPGSNTVEFFFPGFDKKYDGMDYRGLRLTYRMHEGKPKLVAISHDQWTP